MMKNIILLISCILLGVSLQAQNEFEATPAKVSLSIAIENPEYCTFFDFKIKANTSLKDERLIELNNSLVANFFEDNEALIIHSILQFKEDDADVFIINYSELKSDNSSITKFYSNKEAFIYKEDFLTITRLNNDAFWQFYNDEDDPKYPEINRLKAQANDRDHILNINKLATVINENKTQLESHFIN